MTGFIIDRLEQIQVNHHQRHTMVLQFRLQNCLCDPFLKFPAVLQFGQRIKKRPIMQFLLMILHYFIVFVEQPVLSDQLLFIGCQLFVEGLQFYFALLTFFQLADQAVMKG